MITSTYGVQIPESGDKGQIVFEALETNIELFRDHTHNGVNTAKVSSNDLSKGSRLVPSTDVGWEYRSDGTGFEITVTCPGNYTLANCTLSFRVTLGDYANQFIHPTILPISLAQFKIVTARKLDLEILFT